MVFFLNTQWNRTNITDALQLSKGWNTTKQLSVETHLSTVFFCCIACAHAYERFPRHLQRVFPWQKFLLSQLVKTFFSLKYFQWHHQECSVCFLSSIVKLWCLREWNIIFVCIFHELKSFLLFQKHFQNVFERAQWSTFKIF